MRRAMFGGTFDPIHVGHLILAQQVLEQTDIQEVVFVPAATPPHKVDVHLTSGQQRLEMIQSAVEGSSGMVVSDVELGRRGVSYTIDTLEDVVRKTGETWAVIIGADQMLEITSWRRHTDIFDRFPVLLTTRAGVPRNPDCPRLYDKAVEVAVPRLEISASVIRQRVAAGKPITHWVPPAVEAYIARHGLYRAPETDLDQRPSRSSGCHGRATD